MQNPSRLRSTAISAILIVVFIAIAAVFIGALDKAQTCASILNSSQAQACINANLLDPGNLVHYNLNFFQGIWNVLTIGTDRSHTPYRNYFIQGVGLTIQFCFIAMPLAILLGLILAMMSRSKFAILRIPARSFVEFFRNTPLLVQLTAIYVGLAFLPQSFVNAFTAGVATLVLNYGAYECENLRAGLDALDRGQGEAAATLGLRRLQTLQLIEIPQIVPIVLPPVLNDLIYMYKDSSILSLITISELTSQTNILSRQHPAFQWQFYFIGGAIYLLLSLPLGRVARVIEAQIKALKFNMKRDLTIAAMQVLIASVILGVVVGLLVQVVTPSTIPATTIGSSLADVLYSIVLTALIALTVAVVLGGIVYLFSRLIGLLRRGRRPDGVAGNTPGSSQNSDIAVAALSSSDL